jgi:hypothetical protein
MAEVKVEVEESLGLGETKKEQEEEEGVVGIRGFGGTRRHAGARQRNFAVVISRLRTEGKSNRCIEKERPDIAHLLYLRLQVTLLVRLDVAGRNPSCQKKLEMSTNDSNFFFLV